MRGMRPEVDDLVGMIFLDIIVVINFNTRSVMMREMGVHGDPGDSIEVGYGGSFWKEGYHWG